LNSKESLQLTVGATPDGASISLPVTVITGRKHRPRIVVVAGVHGGEFEGVRALVRLAADLSPENVIGTVIIAPVVNPPAYNIGSRLSPIDSLNLNRVCPGTPDGSFTQRLAFQLFEYLFKGADLLIDLHSGGHSLVHAPMAGFYDIPDSIGSLSFRAAQAMRLSYMWRLPLRPGVLSYEAVRAGIPAAGGELGGGSRCLKEHVTQYYAAVKNVLQIWDVLAGDPAPNSDQRVVFGDWILAPASGYFECDVELEQQVTAGEEMATIYGMDNTTQATISSPYDGWVLGQRTIPSIYAGDPAVFVLREGSDASVPADTH
jgi:predicted deacylase